MARLNLQEQEQVNQLKHFWQDYGKYFISVLVVGLVIYLSNIFWNLHKEHQAQNAALIYDQFTRSVNEGNINSVYSLADNLEKNYNNLTYSTWASLIAAKLAWNQNDNRAINYLKWAINNTQDKALSNLAELNLAKIYIDQKKFNDALRILLKKHETAFNLQFYMLRGDLYVIMDNLNKAHDAYQQALTIAGQDTSVAQIIQMRLEAIGGN